MKPVLTATEWRRVEDAYEGDLGEAMERAGYAVALAAVRHGAAYGKKVVVLAGPGNNGGDGYVAARHLIRRGVNVEVHRYGKPGSVLAKHAASRARDASVPIRDLGPVVDCDLVIDALFGGGGRGGIADGIAAWMDTPTPVIAVDFPTGLDPDTGKIEERAFRATETVTFGSLKLSHVYGAGPDHCGVVTLVDIGIDGGEPSMYVAEESDASRPSRPRTAHKWSAGAVLVAGGSDGMVGAATMAARAALRFGAGSVYLSSPHPDEAHLISPQIPALSLEDVGARLEKFDVVVAGPGLAEADIEPVVPIVRDAKRVVLDAGGLMPELLDAALEGDADVVVTPHRGEFSRIAGVGGGQYAVRALARSRGITALLKGNPTLISNGGPPVLVTSGGPELATIGTGDVLAGMIGALMARGLDGYTAAISGSYWHGVAAADLRQRGTVTADELADCIGAYAW